MTILIFICVIVALIVVHEFGHFVAAKLSGMRVDEFGLGYPPRAATIAQVGETRYTLNWLPFGGFVKIFGEDSGSDVASDDTDPRAFTRRPRYLQAVVLVAGIAMNLVFAYVLITGALIAGTPRALDQSEIAGARDIQLAVAGAVPGSPAARAGLLPGDIITNAVDPKGSWRTVTERSGRTPTPESFTAYVSASGGETLLLSIDREGQALSVAVTPEQGIAAGDPERYALGVEVFTVGVIPLSVGEAIVQGAQLTSGLLVFISQGLLHFFVGVFTFSANLTQVSGPVGIAGAVGTATLQGFGSLLSLVAVISINLALINLIPVPALDGGRLLFVIIESLIRRPIKPSVAQTINGLGFAFLILLMVVVTAHDILRIVG